MGGKAFNSGPNSLNITRIPNAQYIRLRQEYQRLLLTFYTHAVIPPSFPGKPDHGDIDILVCKPLSTFNPKRLAEALGAERSAQAGRTTSFAIHFQGESDAYFQLDVHTCRPDLFDWETTIYSYGDLWHIIGACATRFELAINDKGLHLRIKEIEATHRKDSLLFLTSNICQMMRFLGLNRGRFERGIDLPDDVFDWAISSRLFRMRFFVKGEISEKERRVREKRPVYGRFVKEWLPAQIERDSKIAARNQEDADYSDERFKKDILEEALTTFSKHNEYAHMLEKHRIRLLKDTIWQRIAKGLPLEGVQLGRVMVALKKRLRWDRDHSVPTFTEGDGESVGNMERLSEGMVNVMVNWAILHWRELTEVDQDGHQE